VADPKTLFWQEYDEGSLQVQRWPDGMVTMRVNDDGPLVLTAEEYADVVARLTGKETTNGRKRPDAADRPKRRARAATDPSA
jgi:hypothetical protein